MNFKAAREFMTPDFLQSGFYSVEKRVAKVGAQRINGSFKSLTDIEIEQPHNLGITGMQTPVRTLHDYEKEQIAFMYSSLKTEVFVCESTAILKLKDTATLGDWVHEAWGVPVAVLEKHPLPIGNKVWLYLAELGTGFPLWKDVITNESGYQIEDGYFQNLKVSWNRNIFAGFQFIHYWASFQFWVHTRSLLTEKKAEASQEENLLSKLKKRMVCPSSGNRPAISMCEGSRKHITHIKECDRDIYSSMQSKLNEVSEI